RIPVTHFSPWDFNWPWGPQQVAAAPDQDAQKVKDEKDENCSNNRGCIIGASQQTLGHMEPIAGTNTDLYYTSYYTRGYVAGNSIRIPVTSAAPPSGLSGIRIDIDIAGARTTVEFDNTPDQEYIFTWDGLDGYGRPVRGNAAANVTVQYQYPAVRYEVKSDFGQAWAGYRNDTVLGGSRVEGFYSLGTRYAINLGQAGVASAGLGGWTLSNHHAYDAFEKTLYMGNGTEIRADRISDTIERLAGGGNDEVANNVDATTARIRGFAINPASDGGFYVTDYGRIRKVGTDGIISTIAGTGVQGFSGDGGPAVNAEINMGFNSSVVEDRDGNIYFADLFNNRIRKIDTNGIITTIAGDN
ncbi:MAG: hypothetical protein MJE77_33325, partial [Proteobacteria bacterium]|nr:hypothetical protein [Pseudomonadota bacterium]